MNAHQSTIFNRLVAKMRYRHVQAVVLTAEHGSTHKAAEVAGISQPSVAKFLLAVESLIDDPLFERHSRGMRPTPVCAALLPFFQATLKLLQHGTESLADVKSGAAGSVHIGALPAACRGEIMAQLGRFSESYPQFQVHLEENSLDVLNEYLDAGLYDAVFVRPPSPLREGTRFEALQADHSVVLARKGHALARRTHLSLDELAAVKWLVLPSGTTSRTIFEAWFSASVSRPRVVNVSTPSLAALTALVAESDAIAVVPRSFAVPSLSSGQLCALSVARQDPLLPLGILWRPSGSSIAAEKFCRWMIRAKDLEP